MSKFNLNINPLVACLTTFFVCGKNANYKQKDIAYRLIQSAVEHQSLEAMFKLTGYLSADRVLSKLHELTYERIQKFVREVNKRLKLPKKVKLAIDFTDKEYYGDKNHIEVMGSKSGRYVRRYIEMSVVEPALFINALPINQLTNSKVRLLTKLIDGFHNVFDSEIELLLLDRGFFAKEIVKLLIGNNIPFIMPAVRNKAIKKLIGQYEKGEIKSRTKYMFGEYEVNLLFMKVEKETLVYITNTKFTFSKVHLLYRKRWQIETNFREQNNFSFKTKTKDFTARYLAFVLAGLLFNSWQLTKSRLIYNMESYLYKQVLIEELLKLWQEFASVEIIKKLDYLLVA